MGFSKLAWLASSLALLGPVTAKTEEIIAKGQHFYYKNGTQFWVKGIAYQQGVAAGGGEAGGTNKVKRAEKKKNYIDPLADSAACKRDVPIMAAAGTNVIRTYAIDPTKNHDDCMQRLADAGIYVVSDLSEPDESINRDNPNWDTDHWARYKGVIDALVKYPNTLGFFAGNEVTNAFNNTPASAFVKAAVRDSKAYIASLNTRWIGVGYAANDDEAIRSNIAHYFNCGDQKEAIDFWGYNIYEWCGDSTIEKSGYQNQLDFFKNYSVPTFFAEYGCNTVGGADNRTWQETGILYGPKMNDIIAGGIVYMYFEEDNDYGLVKLSGNSVSTMKNYDKLKEVMKTVNPSGVAMDAYKPTNSPAACPAAIAGSHWEAGEHLPPTPNSDTCDCMMKSLACVPSSDLNTDDYGELFGNVCGQKSKPCVGISINATTGVYGAFSMCNSTAQLAHVLDTYYKSQNSDSNSCDWGGKAHVVKPAAAASSCSALLSSASASNSNAATATSGSGSSSSSNVAVPLPIRNALTIGDVAIGFYVLVAMAAGGALLVV